jgi:hypothetical protein
MKQIAELDHVLNSEIPALMSVSTVAGLCFVGTYRISGTPKRTRLSRISSGENGQRRLKYGTTSNHRRKVWTEAISKREQPFWF